MTGYEKELLALAYEASCGVLDLDRRPRDGWYYADASFKDDGPPAHKTLAEALTALLRDLGVEVPERPSEHDVLSLEASFSDNTEFALPPRLVLGNMRYLFRTAPQTVIALLEGGEA